MSAVDAVLAAIYRENQAALPPHLRVCFDDMCLHPFVDEAARRSALGPSGTTLTCTLRAGHDGPHVAHGRLGNVVGASRE